MLTFFGFVGLFNMLLLWPGIIILHFTGVEPFQLPPTRRVLAILLVCDRLLTRLERNDAKKTHC